MFHFDFKLLMFLYFIGVKGALIEKLRSEGGSSIVRSPFESDCGTPLTKCHFEISFLEIEILVFYHL